MDRYIPCAAAFQESLSSVQRAPRKALFGASLGLFAVAVFCFAGHPLSPARIAQRRAYQASPTESQLAVGDIVTQKPDSLALDDRHPKRGSHLRSTPTIAGYLSVPVQFFQNAIKSGWHWVTSHDRAHSSTRADDLTDGTQSNNALAKEALLAQESLKQSFVVGTYDGQEVASSAVGIEKVAGVALLFHGCGQNARDWYELPEHRRIVKQLHDAQIHTVAFSATHVSSNCWSTRFPAEKNEDIRRVVRAFEQLSQNQSRLSDVPRYGIGISSGGSFLSILSGYPAMPAFASQVLYISAGSLRAFRRALPDYPNTLFVHLRARDSFPSRQAVSDARKALLRQGVKLVGEMSQRPTPLRPLTFHSRDPRLPQSSSEHVFKMLLKCRLAAGLPGETNEMCRYTDVLRLYRNDEHLKRLMSTDIARRSLTQMIRVISGGHEVSSSSSDRVVKWLTSNARQQRHDGDSAAKL